MPSVPDGAAPGAEELPCWKTPPEDEGELAGAAVEADGEGEAPEGEGPADPDDPDEPELPAEDDPAAQLPTGGTSGLEPAN